MVVAASDERALPADEDRASIGAVTTQMLRELYSRGGASAQKAKGEAVAELLGKIAQSKRARSGMRRGGTSHSISQQQFPLI
jgi:hypothetical protein